MTRACGIVVAVIGIVEAIAAANNYLPVTTLGLGISMKFVTAVNFIVAGSMLSLMTVPNARWRDGLIFSLGFLQVILYWQYIQASYMIMGTMPPTTSPLGPPSLGTVLAFLVTGMTGMSKAFNGKFAVHRIYLGALILGLSIVGLSGYLFHAPALYWKFGPDVIGMSVATLMLFGLMALGFLTLPAENPHDHSE